MICDEFDYGCNLCITGVISNSLILVCSGDCETTEEEITE